MKGLIPRAVRSALRLPPTRVFVQTSAPALHASTTTSSSLIHQLNRTVADYPTYCSIAHVSGSLGTFAVAFGFFSAIGLDFPALAVGGVVGQLVKKPRLPVDAAMAASLAHAVPGVNRLKLGPLLTPFLDQRHPYPAQPHDDGGISARLVTLIRSAEGPIDAYGGPFMFCTWFNGLATVGTATACAHYGLDVIGFVETLLSSFGPILGCDDAAASAQTMVTVSATSAAAAKCTNSLTLPLRLALLGSFGRPLFAAIDRVREESLRQERATLKTMFRKRPDHPGRLKRRNVVAS